jgi:hypothetical protein
MAATSPFSNLRFLFVKRGCKTRCLPRPMSHQQVTFPCPAAPALLPVQGHQLLPYMGRSCGAHLSLASAADTEGQQRASVSPRSALFQVTVSHLTPQTCLCYLNGFWGLGNRYSAIRKSCPCLGLKWVALSTLITPNAWVAPELSLEAMQAGTPGWAKIIPQA